MKIRQLWEVWRDGPVWMVQGPKARVHFNSAKTAQQVAKRGAELAAVQARTRRTIEANALRARGRPMSSAARLITVTTRTNSRACTPPRHPPTQASAVSRAGSARTNATPEASAAERSRAHALLRLILRAEVKPIKSEGLEDDRTAQALLGHIAAWAILKARVEMYFQAAAGLTANPPKRSKRPADPRRAGPRKPLPRSPPHGRASMC